MRRSICITEPDIAYAGQKNAWRFVLITSSNIPAKSLVRFDPLSQGKEGDWQLPQTGTKNKGNSISMVLPDGKAVAAKEIKSNAGFVQYEFLLPHAVNQGEKLTFEVGAANKEDGEKGGNTSQSYIQRRRPFHLYIDPKGKGDFKEPEIFTIDVKGNFLSNIRIIAPSVVYKNSRFDVIVRFEDKHGNLTGNAPEDTLIELTYDQLRENLNWKLFVPETGFLTLPNLYFNEPGLYRLRLKIANSKTEFISAPMYCFPEEADHLFWGVLRGESDRYDSLINIESALRNFRDDHALQFFATSSAEEEELTSSDNWKVISNMVAEFNEEERFVTMLGFQWSGEDKTEGCHHLIYPKDNKPVLRKKDQKYNALKKIYKSHSPKELLSIPYLTMAKGLSYNFDNFSPEFERVVEIYNSFGSSECSAKNGNIRPIKSESKKGISETEEGSIRKALNRGCRFGFVAGGKDVRGSSKNFNVEGQAQYSAGTTAILTKEYSRDAIFLALYNRRCFATTGARMLVFFNIAGKPLGSELDTKTKPGLFFNRYIHGFIAGTAALKEVVIFRNGVPLVTYTDRENYFEFEHDDTEPLDKVVLKSEIDDKVFAYYYIRATQADGHIAWSSPIWVDYFPDDKKGRLKK